MSAKCHRCNKTVNDIEKLNCSDKIWHKSCFTCKVCHMTLSMETYQDYEKLPYCKTHHPSTNFSAVADTPVVPDAKRIKLDAEQYKYGINLSDELTPILIEKVSQKIGMGWKSLGRYLNLDENVLDHIDNDKPTILEKAAQVLNKWKQITGYAAWKQLKPVLENLECKDIVWEIEQHHPSLCLNNPSAISAAVFQNKSIAPDSSQEMCEMCEALKKFYLKTYAKMDEIVHLVKTPAKVELLNKFIELTVVDADEVEKVTVRTAERELFLKRQMTYKPIKFDEVFSKELSLLLISGIAGIGKTCLLRKCLLDWANGTLWKNVDLVFFLECRKLNQHQNISTINELLKVFYKDIFQESDASNHISVLFVIDGLDEFAHIDELINYNPQYPSKQPIINALAEALNTQKHKCVVAGRVGAISQYKEKVTECADKLTIQIMGFNENGINEYVEKIGNKKECIKSVLKESYFAKAMASVPFYLSAMCAIIAASDFYSFNTMTELYCSIFLYFFQKHICKTNEAVHKMMQSESNKQHVLRVCKVAWELFNQDKILFSQEEMKGIVNDFDEVENELLGFIERVESQLGYQYQFAHLTLMEFCVSVHAHIYLSPEEIISNKKLRSCWPMICGLANENKSCFVRFLANLKNLNEERNSLLNAVLDLVPKRFISITDEYLMFMECFFEAQASITEDMKRLVDEREWEIVIIDAKTAHEVSHKKFFMEKFLDAGCKLNALNVWKKIFSEDEKKLMILCSTNVHRVTLWHPVKIDGWTPKHKIEWLRIHINDTFVSKNEFEGFVLPWIRLAEVLDLYLHDDTNFIDDICEWLRGSNVKWLEIEFRGNYFHNIEEFKVRNTKNVKYVK